MADFGEFDFGEGYFGDGGINPDVVTAGRVAWRFYDGTVTYNLPVNPQSASMPSQSKKVTQQATSAGGQVLYEGRKEVPIITFSGVILQESQYYAFKDWVLKRKQVQITDDLGQQYWVYLKGFKPTRKRTLEYPWYMEFTVDGVSLDRG